jgi:predicted nucleotidyltransferase
MNEPDHVDPIAALQSKLSQKWTSIEHSAGAATKITSKLEKLLTGSSTSDTSIVVFGSLARKEWTSKSDIDWTLLVDGQADPQHLEIAQKISGQLTEGKFQAPGASGIFGNMTFSHDLVQKIGVGKIPMKIRPVVCFYSKNQPRLVSPMHRNEFSD